MGSKAGRTPTPPFLCVFTSADSKWPYGPRARLRGVGQQHITDESLEHQKARRRRVRREGCGDTGHQPRNRIFLAAYLRLRRQRRSPELQSSRISNVSILYTAKDNEVPWQTFEMYLHATLAIQRSCNSFNEISFVPCGDTVTRW
jgi:hypothetical protein